MHPKTTENNCYQFSVATIKHYDKGKYKRNCLFGFTVPEIGALHAEKGRPACGRYMKVPNKFNYMQEGGSGASKPLKPAPHGTLSPARFPLLKVL